MMPRWCPKCTASHTGRKQLDAGPHRQGRRRHVARDRAGILDVLHREIRDAAEPVVARARVEHARDRRMIQMRQQLGLAHETAPWSGSTRSTRGRACSATVRRGCSCSASYTVPIPPRPSSRTIRYLPMRSAGAARTVGPGCMPVESARKPVPPSKAASSPPTAERSDSSPAHRRSSSASRDSGGASSNSPNTALARVQSTSGGGKVMRAPLVDGDGHVHNASARIGTSCMAGEASAHRIVVDLAGLMREIRGVPPWKHPRKTRRRAAGRSNR